MTEYKPRSAWTSSARGGAQLTGAKLEGIVWHWPGTSRDVIGVESESATANRLRGYRNFHVGTRGWADIGYNHAVDQAGRVWDLRGLGRVGAHCASAANPDANHEWMGVLLILGREEAPSAAMVQACRDFRAAVFLERWPGRTEDTGHGREPGVPGAQTSCPGPYAAAEIRDGTFTRAGGSMSWKERIGWGGGWISRVFAETAEKYPDGYQARSLLRLAYGYGRRIWTHGPKRWWRQRLPWWGSWDERWPDLAESYPDGYSAEALNVHQYGHARAGREENTENFAALRKEVRDLFAAQQPLLEAAAQARALSEEDVAAIADRIERITAADVAERLTVDVRVGVDDADPADDEPAENDDTDDDDA